MTEQVEKVALVPCGLCGSPCRVETFGPSNNLETETQIWLCSNAAWFKGGCRTASVYLSADDWNQGNRSAPPDNTVARIVELEGALRGVIDTADSFCDCSGDEVAAQVKIRARAVLGETSSAEGRG